MLFGFNHIKLYVSIFSLFALLCLGLSSCGNDDDENNNQGESTIVDGVNVTKGKKIKELTTYEGNVVRNRYSIEYDAKGRLSIIKEGGVDLALINYDSRLISIYIKEYDHKRLFRFSFSLNTDGYMSTIGTSSLIYDSNGYLVRVDEVSCNKLSTLDYNNNDLIKASISKLASGKLELYYITYDGKNEGDLHVHVNGPNIQSYAVSPYYPMYWQDGKNVVSLIALQSGLFGKVPQSVLHFKDKKEATAFIEYEADDNRYNRDVRISFVYQ